MAAALPLVAWLAEWNAGWPVGDTLRKIQESAEEGTKAMLAAKSIGDLLVNLLIAAVLPAIAEEVFFRGAMQRVFAGITGSGVAAVIITSIIFSAIHLEAPGFVPRVALSMVLGFIYLFSGNLWLSIIAHFCNNALSVLLFYFNGNETESDESYAWYITALSALVVIALFAMMRRSNKNNVLSVSQHQNEE
ncbi:CPBP family intramembrane metalloprotease [Chitinophaga sedimenti]|uniref:CPBP family intramembrane glutamic endopeptidase n=1 Tax=Chitinophaga sedimenti TaxID=2033606 RepID=UPI002004736D|nr:CPBP family intramembrane glutamic endopeptidase [Chitinophaga sedimenti]MCK7558528.1 CPBP family intramembrane metalloprotease [Chitinophaga sedimenti]